MDAISITGIRCYGYTGVLPEEQVLGQWFEVDLKLWLDLSLASQSDLLENTLDYRATIAIVKGIVKTSKFALIEKLAGEIVRAVLEQELVEKVEVRLTKVAAPIPDFGGKIAIELTRSKGQIK
jgi:dihydroneopterin aldolase